MSLNQCVYLIHSPYLKYVKIGLSRNVFSDENNNCKLYKGYSRYYSNMRMHIFMINENINVKEVEKYIHDILQKYRIIDTKRKTPPEHFRNIM